MVENKFTVIDAHCHIYPDKIAVKAARATDTFYDVHGFADGTVGMLKREGRKAGIDKYVVQSVATTPKQVSSINHFIAETAERSGGIVTGLGT